MPFSTLHTTSGTGLLTRVLIFALLGIPFSACAPTMIDIQGHRVFNPEYLWYLESEERDVWQKPEQVIEALRLTRGDVIADIGAGGGYFTERFSKQVGPSGHVYAVDVQQIMIDRLKERVKRNKLDNVTVIKGTFESPLLPPDALDIAFFSSVYKEIDHRISYMKGLRRNLRPGGRVAIIEFYKNGLQVGPEPVDRLYESRVIEELKAAGFSLIHSFDFLPREYFLLFGISNPSPESPKN